MDYKIPADSFDVAAFRNKLEKYRPRTIAFTGKRTESFFYDEPMKVIMLGKQHPERGLPEVLVWSSPSGACCSSLRYTCQTV